MISRTRLMEIGKNVWQLAHYFHTLNKTHKTLTILTPMGGPSLPSQHCFEEKEWLSLKNNNNYIVKRMNLRIRSHLNLIILTYTTRTSHGSTDTLSSFGAFLHMVGSRKKKMASKNKKKHNNK